MKSKLFILAVLGLFLVACGGDKYVCGSKNDHKARASKMKKMAPSMSR